MSEINPIPTVCVHAPVYVRECECMRECVYVCVCVCVRERQREKVKEPERESALARERAHARARNRAQEIVCVHTIYLILAACTYRQKSCGEDWIHRTHNLSLSRALSCALSLTHTNKLSLALSP